MSKVKPPKRTARPAKTVTLLDLFPAYRRTTFAKRAAVTQKGALAELADVYRRRGLVLYIGAGVPRSVGLPGWYDLVRALTVRMMTRKVESAGSAIKDLDDEARWQLVETLYEDLSNEKRYDKPILMLARSLKDQFREDLAREIATVLYRRFAWRRRSQLRMKMHRHLRGRRLEDAKAAFPSGSLANYPLLEAVAALARAERDAKGVQAIINYNYDDLLEEYLRAQKIKCMTVLSGVDPVPDGVLPSYHVHGLIKYTDFGNSRRGKALGNFVFSEDEYHAEYSDPYRWSNMTQVGHLGRYTGLFVGLSMEDPNIRRLIDVTHRQYPETRNFAILTRRQSLTRSKDDKRALLRNLFEEVEEGSFERIGVTVLWVDRHEDIPSLLSTIVQET